MTTLKLTHSTALMWLLILVCTFLGGHARGLAAPEPWHRAYDTIDLDTFVFRHPMTVIDQDELNIARQRAALRVEPQASALAALLEDAEAAQSFTPDPPATMDIMGGYEEGSNLSQMRAWLWRNRHAAYASALAYAYTGEERYADKAVEILNAWAGKRTTFTGKDRGLQLGSWFVGMLYAADLIYEYPGWSEDDREQFKAWWRAEVLPHTQTVMRERDNNWKDAGILGVLAAAVVLEDPDVLREGLVELMSYFHERTDLGEPNQGDWKIRDDGDGAYLPHEVTRNEGQSGVTYTAYALTTAVQALEIARYAGDNLWHHATPDGVTFQDVIESFFRWDILHEPYPWHEAPRRGRDRKNVYEVANNHFNTLPELGAWLQSNRPVNGEQGDEYATLNKGDLPAVTAPARPGLQMRVIDGYDGLYTARISGQDAYLSLLTGAGENGLEPQSILVNVQDASRVLLLPEGLELPMESTSRGLLIDLRAASDGRNVIELALEDGAKYVRGIESIDTSLGIGEVIRGPVSVDIGVVTRPDALPLDSVKIALDGRTIYQGAETPSDLILNQGELSDGLHTLSVRVVADQGTAVLDRFIPFDVLNSSIVTPEQGATVVGPLTVQATTWLPVDFIETVSFWMEPQNPQWETKLLWQGRALPTDLVVDTRNFPDGAYRLVVRMTTTQGASTQSSVNVLLKNRWRIVDSLQPPTNLFGVSVDRSMTWRESDGWQYDATRDRDFFGDASRKVRKANTTEALVWEAPRLRSVAVTLYAEDPAIEDTVALSVSGDGTTWRPLIYSTEVVGESEAGWYELRVVGEHTEDDDAHFFRLELLASMRPAESVHIGEVVMEGLVE